MREGIAGDCHHLLLLLTCPVWRCSPALAAPWVMLEGTKVREGKQKPTDLMKREIIGDCGEGSWTLAGHHQINGHIPKMPVAHLYNFLSPQNTSPPWKAFNTHGLLLFLSSAFKTLQGVKKRSVPVLTATLTPLLKHPTQQDVSLCYSENWLLLLAQRKGHSKVTDPDLECSQRTTGNATEPLLSRVTQLFQHPEAPLLFFPLLITTATASSMNIPTLASPLADQPIPSL